MKKQYVTPQVEKIEFDYAETVVASTGFWMYFNQTSADSCSNPVPTEWHGEIKEVSGCTQHIILPSNP